MFSLGPSPHKMARFLEYLVKSRPEFEVNPLLSAPRLQELWVRSSPFCQWSRLSILQSLKFYWLNALKSLQKKCFREVLDGNDLKRRLRLLEQGFQAEQLRFLADQVRFVRLLPSESSRSKARQVRPPMLLWVTNILLFFMILPLITWYFVYRFLYFSAVLGLQNTQKLVILVATDSHSGHWACISRMFFFPSFQVFSSAVQSLQEIPPSLLRLACHWIFVFFFNTELLAPLWLQ